jgi:DNA-directed RNA polymerase subunit M/transcription elongation factor TFIIS
LGDYSPRIAQADAIGHRFWHKQSSCGDVKSLFEASIQKAQNGPSTQLIEATSCVERWNNTITAEELT